VRADEIPELLGAIRYAHNRGSVVVGASGNDGSAALAYPARATDVLAVGSTTEHGCLSAFSNTGSGLDLVAPGGGEDAPLADDPLCTPDARAGRDISQVTLTGAGKRRFGIPGTYEGTSMSAPHVSGVAAMAIASGAIGPDPTPAEVERHLERTARDLGAPGPDPRYGWGLLDAAAAVRPVAAPAPPAAAPAPAPPATPSG
jgi:serine protease